MSCPTDANCLLYAEDELEPEARRELETHLVGCRDCRERVMALRDEGLLLGSVLREEQAPELGIHPVEAPERGVALGVPLAIVAVSVALAALSFLFEARLPGAWDLLNPRHLKGVSEMAFDLIFLLRESAPGLLELALAVGGVAGLSALLSFAVSSLGRRWLDGAALLGAALFAGSVAPQAAEAFALHRDESLRVDPGQRIEQSVIASGDRVDVDGTIDGDLIAAAERVTVRGEVTGTLYVFTRELEITGSVGGSVHALAERVRVEGSVAGPIYAFTEDFSLSGTGRAAGDLNLVAEGAVLDGEVGRDVNAVGDRLDLRGRVGRDVRAHRMGELVLREGADVGGDLVATLEAGSEVEQLPGSRIRGELRAEPHESLREHYLEHYRHWKFYAWALLGFAATFVLGLVLHWVWPGLLQGSMVTGSDLGQTLILGFVALVVTPLAVLALALTVVGLPVAIALLILFLGALYVSDLAVGAWLGRLVAPPADSSTLAFGKSLGSGLLILTAVALVPYLGPAVGVVVLWIGVGMLAVRIRDTYFAA